MTDLAEPVRGSVLVLDAEVGAANGFRPASTPAGELEPEASSEGTSIRSESLNPTARFLGSSTVYITLTIERPLW